MRIYKKKLTIPIDKKWKVQLLNHPFFLLEYYTILPKMPQRRDNAGAVCNSGMCMLFSCIESFTLGGDFFIYTMHDAPFKIHDGCLVVFA